jgi:hypothetical protein
MPVSTCRGVLGMAASAFGSGLAGVARLSHAALRSVHSVLVLADEEAW